MIVTRGAGSHDDHAHSVTMGNPVVITVRTRTMGG